ncbi:MAG: MaoC/PaaZ C-terminal domain-containing protein [Candidatus Rokubacteria bacterium]|nr:MaoC/PaaZ C-terminal domain-containing protein [Candidatus Rokubacteria bacterium]
MSAAARRAGPTWDDVRDGEELKGFSLELTPTRMVAQVSGTQDFYPIHHDREFAQQAGHKDIFINTAFIRGCLCRLLTDWMGDDGFVKSLGFQMRRPNFAGETISARGRVKKKGPDGRVDLELWLENAGEVTVPGAATVILPVRS